MYGTIITKKMHTNIAHVTSILHSDLSNLLLVNNKMQNVWSHDLKKKIRFNLAIPKLNLLKCS